MNQFYEVWMKRRTLSLLLAIVCGSCGTNEPAISVGGLYSLSDNDSAFQVAKVLALDEDAVHICMYSNKFSSRPQMVDTSALTLGGIHDAAGFGIAHLPLSHESFINSRPVFIQQSSVTEEELEGYKMWKADGGGVW